MPRMLRAWALNRRGKNLVGNLQYGPRTRLVRGIYMSGFMNQVFFFNCVSNCLFRLFIYLFAFAMTAACNS